MRASLRAFGLLVLATMGCAQEPEELPPFAEVKIVIDTDLDVSAFVARLQVDLYDGKEGWFFSRELQREDPRVWPNSFVLVGPKADDPGAETKEVLVRLRLYPDGKFRDYRGERFFPPGFLDGSPADTCLPLFPPGGSERDFKILAQFDDDGVPLTPFYPLNDPLPDLTIDRLVPVRIVPGKQGEIRVTLTGDCLGAKASFGATTAPGDEFVCVDGVYTRVFFTEPSPIPSTKPKSVAGTFPSARPCTEPLRRGDFQSFEDEVCIDGGMFILGDPAVFAYGDFDAVPERFAILGPLRMDRFEVTVGRFRKALATGLLGNVALPIANDGPLDFGSAEESRSCTFSTMPQGREAYPLNCVSWQTARAFCQALGGDLPTEAQWEYVAAASGRNNRETRHAWGSDDPTCERAVFARASSVSKGAVDCAPDPADQGLQPLRENEAPSGDLTPSGVVGMAGNVREFTLDDYRPYCARCWFEAPLEEPQCAEIPTAFRTVRGGDWASDEDSLLVGLRNEALAPDAWSSRVGFRCVRPGDNARGE